MNLLQEIEQIPMINDHTHIFGCGVPTYEEAGRSAIFDTPEDVLIGLSVSWKRAAGSEKTAFAVV